MTPRNLFLIAAFLFSACSNSPIKNLNAQNNLTSTRKSRVLDFNYGGYDDTIYAVLGGNIYELNTSTNSAYSLHALQNVSIRAEQNNKTVFTDASGNFGIGLEKGIFSLLIT